MEKNYLLWGTQVLEREAHAILEQKKQLGADFVAAVKLIASMKGRLVLTGLGKSGHIARKIAATCSSTGTPAYFLHPSEALHGDLGALSFDDVVLAIAFSGETEEVLQVVAYAKQLKCPVISLTGKRDSSISKQSDVSLVVSITEEADGLNLAPTVSTTVCLAMGDAIAIALMREKGIGPDDFAKWHPGGGLGRKLARVNEFMRQTKDLPVVNPESDFHQIVEAVTKPNFGIVAVVDKAHTLLGAVTDGDLRRALLHHGANALTMNANHLMTREPKITFTDELALSAVRLMEAHNVTALFVLDRITRRLEGLLRLHDLLAGKIV